MIVTVPYCFWVELNLHGRGDFNFYVKIITIIIHAQKAP